MKHFGDTSHESILSIFTKPHLNNEAFQDASII